MDGEKHFKKILRACLSVVALILLTSAVAAQPSKTAQPKMTPLEMAVLRVRFDREVFEMTTKTPAPEATSKGPGFVPCGLAAIKRIEDLSTGFLEKVELARSTPRLMLSARIGELQNIRSEVRSLDDCGSIPVATNKVKIIRLFDQPISDLMAFLRSSEAEGFFFESSDRLLWELTFEGLKEAREGVEAEATVSASKTKSGRAPKKGGKA